MEAVMKAKHLGRRRFLKNGAALASLAVAGIGTAKGETAASDKPEPRSKNLYEYGERSHFETAVRTTSDTKPYSFYVKQRLTPLQDSIGIITPSALHFFNSHGYDPPDIDPQQHRLLIHGMVDR